MCCISFASPSQAGIIYTDKAALGENNGTSWENAYRNLQTAIENAVSGDEIWVKAETYTPHSSDRTISFELKDGVAIYGGFSGSESVREQRNWTTNVTILSGDIGTEGEDSDNTQQVIRAENVEDSAILDGFTITKGNADSLDGGGVVIDGASPTIRNCIFSANSADDGGGIYIRKGSPVIENCIFSANSAIDDGGGIYNESLSSPSTPTLINCIFSENTASSSGGGIYNSGSNPSLTDCIFENNTSENSHGGAIFNKGTPNFTNCIFRKNTAKYNGGAIYSLNTSSPLMNCIFSGNISGSNGGAMFNSSGSPEVINCTFSGNTAGVNGGGINNDKNSSSKIYNSIFWGNTASDGKSIYNQESSPIVAYCIVEGGYADGTNISSSDPNFTDADGEDDIFGTPDDNLHLKDHTSPAIDAGDNTQLTRNFKLTDEILNELRNQELSEEIIADLETLKDQEYTNENEFKTALQNKIGEDRTTQYGSLILEYACTATDTDGNRRFVDIPTKTDTGNGTLLPVADMGAYEHIPPSPPVITSFTPLSGGENTSVTITGTEFIPGATEVKFGGTNAISITEETSTSLIAEIGTGTTGKITVTTPGGTATSTEDFTFIPAPTIATDFTSLSVSTGESVIITGTDFIEGAEVKFGVTGELPEGVAASVVTLDSETQLTAVVAPNTFTGKVTVTTAGGTITSGTILTIDELPTVVEAKKIADMVVKTDDNTTLEPTDLTGLFTDPDSEDDAIQLTAESDNSDIITAAIDGNMLTLVHHNKCGTANITIHADSGGKTAAHTFVVTVSPVPGDMNCDREVNLNDAIILFKILTATEDEDTRNAYNADANDDGRVGVGDLVYILKTILRQGE
ncbi:Polymorphic outer membrane protein repeat-containing protein [Desulfonema magnum]|uniref:Probable pectate lyase C n=2 Tax=Desulfonema magnum TaxID=45655 RepID=A0A975GQT2_9BACT|nr:Polymorphic outer membrane protein repeat-containing protein [Desulfonema magnum]